MNDSTDSSTDTKGPVKARLGIFPKETAAEREITDLMKKLVKKVLHIVLFRK